MNLPTADAAGPAPLAGRRILVTRAQHQAGELIDQLRAAGAQAIAIPLIEIQPPASWAPLDQALDMLVNSSGAYAGLIFTSANAVRACFERASARGRRLDPPANAWICAIGPATAAELERHGWSAGIVPQRSVAEGVVEALAGFGLYGRHILLPRAAVGRDLIPEALRQCGAHVDVVECYRTVRPAAAERQLQSLLLPPASPPDAIIFASSSAASHFVDWLARHPSARLGGVTLAAIGPIARQTLEQAGLAVTVQPESASFPALVQSLARHYRPECDSI